MTILDTNGLIHCLDNSIELPNDTLLVTEDLKDEYDTALLINGHRTVNMTDLSATDGYAEAFYLKEYTRYLNSFGRVDLASMRGIADVSILAAVSCIVNSFGNAQQVQMILDDVDEVVVTIITTDGDLINRLQSDFGGKTIVKDPSTI